MHYHMNGSNASNTNKSIVNNNDDDDIATMASAFGAANDADVRLMMNVFYSGHGLPDAPHYVVPADWYRRVWDILGPSSAAAVESAPAMEAVPPPQQQQQQSPQQYDENDTGWRERVGKINNFSILQLSGVVGPEAAAAAQAGPAMIDDHDDETCNHHQPALAVATIEQQQQNSVLQQPVQPLRLRAHLQHERDYYLLGPNAWLLLSNKFGHDVAVPMETGRDDNSSRRVTDERTLLVRMVHQHEDDGSSSSSSSSNNNAVRVEIIRMPPTFRFPYERSLQPINAANIGAGAGSMPPPPPPGNVSDDDDATTAVMMADDHDDAMPQISPLLPVHNNGDDDDDHDGMSISTREQKQPLLLTNGDDNVHALRPYVPDHPPRAVWRKYGSGLANLGNTCFMNSSLQCLAHTAPLQRYFLSGDYVADLNRDNPLGTGGDLATQFADLLGEMWGTKVATSTKNLYTSNHTWSSNGGTVIYPRSFKVTLGKHAEQFMGYDQHDSQEFLTYLLDALHEDTNRITRKPYIEKPEQADGESDQEAADKAWQLHVQREDSRVLGMFMGQIKSRVQCNMEGCGRVSTTFDPSMYLSVPIPGSSETTIPVTFVPLDASIPAQALKITLPKAATFAELLRKTRERVRQLHLVEHDFLVDDLVAVDMWNKDIYTWYDAKHEVDRVKDNDETFVYQLRPKAEVRQQNHANAAADSAVTVEELQQRLGPPPTKRYRLDVSTLSRLDRDWLGYVSSQFLAQPDDFTNAFDENRGLLTDRVRFYEQFVDFVEACFSVMDELAAAADSVNAKVRSIYPREEQVFGFDAADKIEDLQERCQNHAIFRNVDNKHALAVVEDIVPRMRRRILDLHREKHAFPDGVVVQVQFCRSGVGYTGRSAIMAAPLVMRIPSFLPVYALREEVAFRLSRSVKTGYDASHIQPLPVGESTAENGNGVAHSFGSPEVLLMRQAALTCERDESGSTLSRTFNKFGLVIGSVDKPTPYGADAHKPIRIASPHDEAEQENVTPRVREHGKIAVQWPSEFAESSFDVNEFEKVETPLDPAEAEGVARRTRNGSKSLNVLDCIEKYCHMEQLEESEMWYCNRCKTHVQAWKQYHLYRAPPILIIHLKRFQYSASTHRRDKIGVHVDFPLQGLDLTSHVLNWVEAEKPVYDCYGVSNHFGGLGGGHYTAYALNEDDVWCYYDDGRISVDVDPKDVVSQAAYVLYYRRRDVQTDMSFLSKLQTTPLDQPTPVLIQDNGDKLLSAAGSEADDGSASHAAMVGDDEQMDMDDGNSRTMSSSSLDGENFYDADAQPQEDSSTAKEYYPLQ